MRHPPSYLSKLGGVGLGASCGGGGFGWGVYGGDFGRGGGGSQGGGACTTHYYHMHTSGGRVCLGVWGYGGMYVIIALSRHCREEVLRVAVLPPSPLPPSPFPLPPSPLFPRARRLVCHLYSASSC